MDGDHLSLTVGQSGVAVDAQNSALSIGLAKEKALNQAESMEIEEIKN